MATESGNFMVAEAIVYTLTGVGLVGHESECVVIGGAALAAQGVKVFESDIDIAATDELLRDLEPTGQWQQAWRAGQDWGDTKCFIPTGAGYNEHVELLRQPLDAIYPITARELIEEGVKIGDSNFVMSPLARVLHWKLALIDSSEYTELKKKTGLVDKHRKDILAISEHLVRK